VAGPAFNAGRYGQACGALCQAVGRELGIPAVTGMHEENPGVELYHRDVYVIRTGDTARNMAADLAAMLRLGRKLVDGAPVGRPGEEGYFPRGEVRAELAAQPAAVRAVDMLMAKLVGQPFETEVRLPRFQPTPAPPPVPAPPSLLDPPSSIASVAHPFGNIATCAVAVPSTVCSTRATTVTSSALPVG